MPANSTCGTRFPRTSAYVVAVVLAFGSVAAAHAIVKADQTISFPPLADATYGAPPYAVPATASSGLTVKFVSQTANVCTVAGSIAKLKSAGTCILRASQAGNANYNAAPPVDRSFSVVPLPLRPSRSA